MIFKSTGRFAAVFTLAAVALTSIGPPQVRAEICDDAEKPPRAVYGDSLVLPAVEWSSEAFYPSEGTWLDSIGNQYYQLETHFEYFGLMADFDLSEENPPHHYLPYGWRDLEMTTFRWNKPSNGTLVRAPSVLGSAVWVDDPAPGGDSVMISARPVIYGDYEGHRDQVFRFEYRIGSGFIGGAVPSSSDSTYLAWDVGDWSADWDPQGVLAAIGVGDSLTINTEVAWSEAWGPDAEFAFAPGDELHSGVIELYCRYTRLENGELALVDSDLDCVHEMDLGLYVSFTPGLIPIGYLSEFVAEDFEGYHVWRRVNGGGRWENIWELSKNEELDKFFWWWIQYEKDPMTHEITYEWETLTPVFGQTDQRVFLDFDVHNGFFYDYAITTYDRGFRPQSGGSDHYILDSTPQEDLDTIARRVEFDFPAAENLDRSPAIYAVPNPLRTGKSALQDPNYHNFPGDVVHFVGLTDDATLRVYTLTGDLVFTAENHDPTTRNIIWDTRNQKGREVASGVYIYHVLDHKSGGDAYGHLVIIR